MLPEGWLLSATPGGLKFDPPTRAAAKAAYAYDLAVPGAIDVPEAGTSFQATLVPASAVARYNPDHMLDPTFLRQELTVRNWRAGDRYWPAHSKSPKKIKELLQERKVTGAERRLWPVVASGQEIVWLRGFPTPARLRPQDGARQALLIRELPSQEDARHE
jgi:tRNA(Ile)-lysidine synthase